MAELSAVSRHPGLLIPIDGETVAATRYEPTDAEGPLPALVMHIPYHKDDQITFGAYDPLVLYLARHGYEVVVSDVLGTGASSGRKDDSLTPAEATESAAVVEWVARQSWCDGSVGMFGKSYGGATCLKAAAERPEGLEAIVPIHAPFTGYRDTYEGGAFALYGMGGHWTPLMQALQALPPTRRDDDGRWARVWRERLDGLGDREPWLFTYLDHETRDDYWRGREIPVERIEVPTFAVSGWRDSYPATTVEFVKAIDAPTRLLLGPWRHTMPHRGRETAVDFRQQVREWFDRHLKGVENCADDRAPVEFWTETDGGGREERGVWRGRETWPAAEDAASFAVTPDGLARAETFDGGAVERRYEVDHTVGVDSFDVDAPPETTPDDIRSLCYETDALETPLEVTGTGSATVRVRAESADPLVAVRVVDVSPDGTGTLVTQGVRRASCRSSFDDVERLEAGECYEVDVPLKPTSHLFEEGHRIRVAVSGALFPAALPTRDGDGFTLLSTPDAPTTVSIPASERKAGASDFERTIEMGDPDETVPPAPEAVTDSDASWSVTRDQHADAATVETTACSTIDLPHADRMTYEERIEASVEAADALSASVARTTEISVEYPTETVTVEASSRAARDQATATTLVTVDGEKVFERTWTRP